MEQRIVSFDRDEEHHWRARLACGHYQHVRHDPPLISRPWVLTPEGRRAMIGRELQCVRCDQEARGEQATTRGD